MESVKVSLIIPVHNAEQTIEKCIESVIKQSYKNIQCILIENGSSDRTIELCSKYAEKYDQITLLSENIKGVSKARNIGLSIASGDIIGFCDSDDFLKYDCIKLIVDEFNKDPNTVVVIGGYYEYRFDNNKFNKKSKSLPNQKVTSSKALQLMLTNDLIMGSVWNKYYRSEVIKEIKFDTQLIICEDMHFNAVVLSSISDAYNVKIISNEIYCYVENKKSVTHNYEILFNNKNEFEYIEAMKKILFDCHLTKKQEKFVKMKIACFAIDTLNNISLDVNKENVLIGEVKNNFRFLLTNFFVNNWKWNVKRILDSIKIILKKG